MRARAKGRTYDSRNASWSRRGTGRRRRHSWQSKIHRSGDGSRVVGRFVEISQQHLRRNHAVRRPGSHRRLRRVAGGWRGDCFMHHGWRRRRAKIDLNWNAGGFRRARGRGNGQNKPVGADHRHRGKAQRRRPHQRQITRTRRSRGRCHQRNGENKKRTSPIPQNALPHESDSIVFKTVTRWCIGRLGGKL
jgi:hypothetical protein